VLYVSVICSPSSLFSVVLLTYWTCFYSTSCVACQDCCNDLILLRLFLTVYELSTMGTSLDCPSIGNDEPDIKGMAMVL
jgi:hypothetical protein